MKIKPILFNTPMARAIMNGSKTQTRRIIKPQPLFNENAGYCQDGSCYGLGFSKKETERNFTECRAKYQIDDIIWVREMFFAKGFWEKSGLTKSGKQAWTFNDDTFLDRFMSNCGYKYFDSIPDNIKSGHNNLRGYYKRPSIFMPKEACRNFLKTTKVRVERVQDISEEDAIAEGVLFYDCDITKGRYFKDYLTKEEGYGHPDHDYPTVRTAKESFESLWISINGQESWDSNPYVWVYDFIKTDKPKNFI